MKKQKPWLGFSLALLATMTWGSLPVIAQQALKAVDAPTLVWIRFLVASLVLFALLGLTGKLPRPSEFSKQTLFLLVLGIVGISANFVLVALGLHYISPTTTQVLWQLSPFTMILVGVGVFKEAFTHLAKNRLDAFADGFGHVFQRQIRRTFQLGQLRGRRDDGGFGQHDLGVLRRGAKTFVQTFQFATNPAHDLFL